MQLDTFHFVSIQTVLICRNKPLCRSLKEKNYHEYISAALFIQCAHLLVDEFFFAYYSFFEYFRNFIPIAIDTKNIIKYHRLWNISNKIFRFGQNE